MDYEQTQVSDDSAGLLADWEEPPLVMVISAPSGAGKSTICHRVIDHTRSSNLYDRELEFSVSTTTREPRRSEVDGTDYNFVSRETFRQMQKTGEFLEYAEVHGEMYGTSRQEVIDSIESGKDVLLEIDVQGGEQVLEKLPNALLIFIAPPSLGELEQRLKNRGTETPEEIHERLDVAREEIQYADQYDYVVINDEIDSAVKKVRSIRAAEKCRLNRQDDSGFFGLLSN